jgi:hypothetical protein
MTRLKEIWKKYLFHHVRPCVIIHEQRQNYIVDFNQIRYCMPCPYTKIVVSI